MSEGVGSRELRLYWVEYSVSLPAAGLGLHLDDSLVQPAECSESRRLGDCLDAQAECSDSRRWVDCLVQAELSPEDDWTDRTGDHNQGRLADGNQGSRVGDSRGNQAGDSRRLRSIRPSSSYSRRRCCDCK